ncbi:uncharacterized protein [Chelonus insularis]|uniref:uncharacterized protein n=1 Tax=Chelonus insularis TaxID=460826 RepID=UPI00158F422A|nr:uncharacterized protein LOC118069246 [Chelonus insularis]
MWIKLLTIFIFAKLCVSQKVNDIIIGKDNIRSLVAVFHTPNKLSLTDDLIYDYQCPGILIHPRAALVLSYCWSHPSQTLDAVVRSYDWLGSIKIDKRETYQERSVTEILNFVSYDSAQSTASHLNILVLSEAFEIRSTTGIIPYNSYSNRGEPTRNECFTIYIEGNVTKGLSLKTFPIWPTNLVGCCMNWQPSLLSSNDFAGELNKCVAKLNGLTCYESINSRPCTNLDAMGAAVFCQKQETPGEYYLRGFLADRKKCKFVITHIGEQKWWIRQELDLLEDNSHIENRLYKLITSR